MASKARSLIIAVKRNRPLLTLRPNPPPSKFDNRRSEQVAAQRYSVAPRDIAFSADRFEIDETSVCEVVHARKNAAAGIVQSNGNFESVEED